MKFEVFKNIKNSQYSRFVKSMLASLLLGLVMWWTSPLASASTAPRLSVPGCRAAQIGVEVVDLRTGVAVVSQNPQLSLTPASIVKSVTAAAVLSDNRGQQRMLTPAYLYGTIDEATFHGDLVIEGHGDPTNESEFFPEYQGFADSIASRLVAMGVNRIEGAIKIDNSEFPYAGPGKFWDAEDLPWYYGAGIYPLNYRNNTYAVDRAIKDPCAAFTKHLTGVLKSHGITVAGSQSAQAKKRSGADMARRFPLYTQLSPQFTQIMRSMMCRSDNLYAEAMLRTLAPASPVDSALSKENAVLSRIGLDTSSLTLYDGSGLTRKNRVTPAFMADMLTVMALGHYAYEYVSLFPKAGQEGTVEHFLNETPLAGRLVLKSGSMRSVQCFAGYKLDEGGFPTHAVVVMVNGFANSQKGKVRSSISDFLLKLFADGDSEAAPSLMVQTQD